MSHGGLSRLSGALGVCAFVVIARPALADDWATGDRSRAATGAALAYRAIMTLPQPSALSALLNGSDGAVSLLPPPSRRQC